MGEKRKLSRVTPVSPKRVEVKFFCFFILFFWLLFCINCVSPNFRSLTYRIAAIYDLPRKLNPVH
jgi:hypothetical protein